jgi:hypothetical protein
VIARELDSETAQRLAADLTKAGAAAEVRPSEPAPPTDPAPKQAWLDAWLQPNETVEATMRTSELLFKSDVIFTSSRILVAGVSDDPSVESVPYGSITSFDGMWGWV